MGTSIRFTNAVVFGPWLSHVPGQGLFFEPSDSNVNTCLASAVRADSLQVVWAMKYDEVRGKRLLSDGMPDGLILSQGGEPTVFIRMDADPIR